MTKKFKKFFKESALYLCGLMLTRMVTFLLLPIYTNVFDRTQNGIVMLAYAFLGFMMIILPYGTDTALLNFYLKDDRERKNYFTNAYGLVLCSNLIILGLAYLAKDNLSSLILRVGNSNVFVWCLVILFFDTLNALPLLIMKAEGRPLTFISFSLINVGLMMGLNFLLVVRLRLGIAGIFYSNIITSALIWIGLLPLVLKRLDLRLVSGKRVRTLVKFGLPFLPSGIFAMIMDLSDRWFLEYFTDIETVGLYGVGYKLATIMLIFILAFNSAWQPFFLQQSKERNAPNMFARISVFAIGGMAFIWLIFSLWMDEIVRIQVQGKYLIGEQFWAGTDITSLIMLAYFFQALYLLQLPGIYILEKTRWAPVFRGLGAMTNIILNIILIPRFGMTGAAVATILAYLAMATGIWFFNRKHYPIAYNYWKIGAVVGLTAIAYLIVRGDTIASRVIATLVGLFGIGVVLLWPPNRPAMKSSQDR